MQKREAKSTVTFRHWLVGNAGWLSGGFELKQTTTDSIPFAAVKQHQLDALMACKTDRGLLYKAPDDSRGIKPFDLFYLRGVGAWVVIHYPGVFEIIDIETFVQEKERSKRKSLTKERANEISTITVEL